MFFSWILLLIVIAILVVIGIVAWAYIFGASDDGVSTHTGPDGDVLDIITANRAAVSDARFQDVEFSVVPRGYRPDQVEALVADCQAEILRLRQREADNESY